MKVYGSRSKANAIAQFFGSPTSSPLSQLLSLPSFALKIL